MDASIAFYRDAVGLAVLAESPEFSFLDAGNLQLGLNVDVESAGTESTMEVVFEVDDIAKSHAAMLARGVPFEIEPRMVMENAGRQLHAAHFRDPDGHVLSITGWVDESSGAH